MSTNIFLSKQYLIHIIDTIQRFLDIAFKYLDVTPHLRYSSNKKIKKKSLL